MSRIPIVMGTQHPDSASKFLSSQDEVEEAVLNLRPIERGGFGCDEQMIDYEGKLTPYHQPRWIIDRLAEEGLVPGEDYLLTPRIPLERYEDVDRQIMVLWSIMTASKHSRHHGGFCIKYVIHPMAETSRELLVSHRRANKLKRFAQEEIGLEEIELRLIPLFEDVVRLLQIVEILGEYCEQCEQELGLRHDYLRVFLGKSDAAMLYGHLSSCLALKYALSKLAKWEQEEGIPIYPMIGVGKLPFRGHLSPERVDDFVREYAGFWTVTLQSGLRYDVGLREAQRVVKRIREGARQRPKIFDEDLEKLVVDFIKILSARYLEVIAPLAERICEVSDIIPERRERVGRAVYSRSFSSCLPIVADKRLAQMIPTRVALPRAIKFTASLYSIGIPPSLIGLGRGLREVREKLGEDSLEVLLKEIYPSLEADVRYDLQFYDPRIAEKHVQGEVLEEVRRDIAEAQAILGVEREETEVGMKHSELLREAWKLREAAAIADKLLQCGILRGSLG